MRVKDLTPKWLIKTHFFGLYGEDEKGEVFLPNPQNPSQHIESSVIQEAIDAAIARVETHLGLSIIEKEQIVEFHNYDRDMAAAYMMINLRSYPIIKVHSLQIVYGEQGATIWDVPIEMIQTHGLRSKFGMLQVLPMLGVSNSYDPAFTFFTFGTFQSHNAPSMFKVTYDAGLEGWIHSGGSPKSLPFDLVRAIGLIAAIHPFNILGDLVIGAGISSVSTSVDGISQSINTTSSAENSAFSSRIIMHRKELYGEGKAPGLLQNLEKEWKRLSICLL